MGMIYAANEVMPDVKDVESVIVAKLSYDKAKAEKTPGEFQTWVNDRTNYFKVHPKGIAYAVSQKSYTSYVAKCRQSGWKVPKSYAPKALRYYIIAAAIGWTELVDELKKTLRYWEFTSADLKQYALDVWQQPNNMDAIVQMIEDAQGKSNIKLIEAVEKHATLNTKLFTKDEVLKEAVRKKMLAVVDEFLGDLKEQDVEIKVDDILLIGSNASYNYTKNSDIDLHIIANTKAVKYDEATANALYGAYRTLFNRQLDITMYDIPVELFIETEDCPRASNGVYSVKKDKWVRKPVPEEIPEYDKDALKVLVDKWAEKCDKLLAEADADKLKDEKRIVKLLEDIYEKLRKKGVAKSEYSLENLAFKELRNDGYLDKLKKYRNALVSKRLSLEETLTRQARADVQRQLWHAAGTQPIVQDNGMFFIYNLKASEISRVMSRLRQLPFVVDVYSHENGKYDFSNVLDMAMNRMPSKYYDIRGRIDETAY
jgi:predicted nucleotidyltransferase